MKQYTVQLFSEHFSLSSTLHQTLCFSHFSEVCEAHSSFYTETPVASPPWPPMCVVTMEATKIANKHKTGSGSRKQGEDPNQTRGKRWCVDSLAHSDRADREALLSALLQANKPSHSRGHMMTSGWGFLETLKV